jgi:hydrogenase maturation protein HypF
MSDSFVSRTPAVNTQRPAWTGSARNGVCPDCLTELYDPRSRRYHYPFVSCPECGPGYTITYRLPFSRANTTMAPFEPCEACLAEFEDPSSRHFGSPTVCCPDCGPSCWIEPSPPLPEETDAAGESVRLLRAGAILALKDTCSFRLIARADDRRLLQKLRRRIDLPGAPLGVMVADLAMARELAEVDEQAAQLLTSPSAPLVLLPRRASALIAWEVTAGAQEIAVMLPRAPIHHLILAGFGQPIVVTRACRGDDVMVLENEDARDELMTIADHLVLHDLDLHAGCEDSKIRVEPTGPVVLRRASGFAPRPLTLPRSMPPVLAIGGRHDVTIAIAEGETGRLSQPVGDLLTPRAQVAFERMLERMLSLWDCEPRCVAFDPLRETYGRALAARKGARPLAVDHHHAHVAAVLAEYGRSDRVLGISLDSTGLDIDPDLASGRLLEVDPARCELLDRVPGFRVPCADQAPRDPWRVALGMVHDLLGASAAEVWASRLAPDAQSARSVLSMLESGSGCIEVHSFGRLYDAAAALIGLVRRTSVEGQVAQRLEIASGRTLATSGVAWEPTGAGPAEQLEHWARDLVERAEHNAGLGEDARWVQISLARWAAVWAVDAARSRGLGIVAAAGGCLTNPWLRQVLRERVESAGLELLLNHEIPPGDGGLALGQVWVAAHVLDTMVDTDAPTP